MINRPPFSTEQFSIGHRIAITFCIVLAILFALALIGFLSGRWEQASAEGFQEPPVSPYDDTMRAIELEAIEESYRDRLTILFSVWMKDDTGQPARAIQGARKARHAFIAVMQEIEKRGGKPAATRPLLIERRPFRMPGRDQ